MDVAKRREAARREILESTQLIHVARGSVYGVPELFLGRIEIAVARLRMLDRVDDVDQAAVRLPGTIDFLEPLVMLEPSVRTQKQRRRR